MLPRVGTDICRISRIAALLAKPGQRLVQRILTPGEQATFRTLEGPRAAEWLAGRWAAKEAVKKASAGPVAWSDIEVFSPSHPGVLPGVWAAVDGVEARISIAHDGDYATAVAIRESDCIGDSTVR